jgi:hypothetical protein
MCGFPFSWLGVPVDDTLAGLLLASVAIGESKLLLWQPVSGIDAERGEGSKK